MVLKSMENFTILIEINLIRGIKFHFICFYVLFEAINDVHTLSVVDYLILYILSFVYIKHLKDYTDALKVIYFNYNISLSRTSYS